MNAHVYPSQHEKVISGAGAFGMHLLFIALLVFGVNWQKKVEPQANIVDLWTNLPSKSLPKVESPPPEPPPPPVAPPKVEPPPPPKTVVKPEVAKPDIAIKEKSEKAEKENVEKERRLIEQQKSDARKRGEEKQQQAREATEAQRLAKEQEDIQRKQAEQATTARAAQVDKYKKAISDKIRRFIVLPPNIQGNPEAEFSVPLLPDGNVMAGVNLKRTSGNTAYDNAVERAILRAQPLPVPPDPAMFREFRELNLKFRPQE